MTAIGHQVLVCTYHETGTVLFDLVFSDVARRLGLSFGRQYGWASAPDPRPDVLMVAHAQLGGLPQRPFRLVRVVRDPRDIWLSGYLYHLHCDEPWWTSIDFDDRSPITFPRVPLSFQYRRERWKGDYLRGLGGRSYRANLNGLDRDAGLMFELARYTGLTLETMRAWRFAAPECLDVRLEDVDADFDGEMMRVFGHLGLGPVEELVALVGRHDLARQDAAIVTANPHVHGPKLSKWRTGLTGAQVAVFQAQFGDIIRRLGYPLAST